MRDTIMGERQYQCNLCRTEHDRLAIKSCYGWNWNDEFNMFDVAYMEMFKCYCPKRGNIWWSYYTQFVGNDTLDEVTNITMMGSEAEIAFYYAWIKPIKEIIGIIHYPQFHIWDERNRRDYFLDFASMTSKEKDDSLILDRVIEIDGKQHLSQIEYDNKRDDYLRSIGGNVLRFRPIVEKGEIVDFIEIIDRQK